MLVCPKDPVPVKECKGVMYSIPCVEYSSVYIGETGRSLKQRVNTAMHWRMGTSKCLPWQSMCSRLDMQWTSASRRCYTITSTPPHTVCWRAGTSSTTRQSWTGTYLPSTSSYCLDSFKHRVLSPKRHQPRTTSLLIIHPTKETLTSWTKMLCLSPTN